MADNKERYFQGKNFLRTPVLRIGDKPWIGDESNGWPEGEEFGSAPDLSVEQPISWLNVGGASNPDDESE